ncbi:MAG: hypothetical protein AAGA90_07645 [Actinomycetota bacterium]
MEFRCSPDRFHDEAEAIAMATARGEYPVALDIEAVRNDFHWHDFQTTTYIVDGELTIELRDGGERFVCGPGTMITASTPHIVHREITDGYRAVFGFDRDPRHLTMPIDKDPADHPATLA